MNQGVPAGAARLADADDADEETLRLLHRTLIAPNFAADQLEREDVFVADLRSPVGFGVLAWTKDGRLVGGMTAHHHPECGVLLLSYLAVDPAARGRGIGSALVRHAQRVWFPRLSPVLMLGEVEDPRKHEDVGFGAPWPRFRLYGRFGARVLDLPYVQPALGPDRDRVRGLLLMVFASADARPGAVDGGPVRCFLRGYFDSCEGSRRGRPATEPDAELAALLAACDDPAGVPLLGVGELPGR